MSMFLKNLSIRIKILGPVTVLGIMLMCVGVMGVLGTANIMRNSNDISQSYVVGLENVGEIQGSYQSLRRIAFAHIVASNSNDMEMMDILNAEGKTLLDSVETSIASYEDSVRLEEQKRAAEQFQADFASYMEVWDSILEASNKGDVERASKQANSELRERGTALTASLASMNESLKKGIDSAVATQEHAYDTSRLLIFIFIGIGIVVFAFTVWVSWVWCCKRLININKQLRDIIKSIEEGRGDLTKRVQSFCTDEIATLSAGINIFIETLHKIMGQINGSSTQLAGIVQLVSQKVDRTNESSVDISSAMEGLSASMQEVSSTVEGIKGNVEDADANIIELAEESHKLYGYANEMQERARKMEQEAAENSKATSEVVNGIVESLKRAIEDSKSVEKVNSLTDEILSISSQTNLLSLNASIEAARAGDAGRGFAVVADEISQLANSSREAASNIQSINNMIVKAVNELIKNSDEMVQYITENILPDYESFVNAGRQYNDDALHVNETVTMFNHMSDKLQEMMQNITNAVSEIASTVDASAESVSNVAANTSGLVQDIGEIASAMDNNKQVAGSLEEEADRFINLDV